MQREKVQVADGLNGGCGKIRRGLRRFFQTLAEPSIARRLAELDEISERFATDLCRRRRSTDNATHTLRKYHVPSPIYAGCRPVDREPQRLRDRAGTPPLLLALLRRDDHHDRQREQLTHDLSSAHQACA
jgi:hypothetical protein